MIVGPMPVVSAQFQYPDSGKYWLSVYSRGRDVMWPNASSFGSRTQASVSGPILGCHSSHVRDESGNRSQAKLFLPACRIWAIIRSNCFGYLGNHLHFTFMHLADTFIQSDLQCIQVKHFLSVSPLFVALYDVYGQVNMKYLSVL